MLSDSFGFSRRRRQTRSAWDWSSDVCSSDLGDEAEGIIALPEDASVGLELSEYLELPDNIFDLDLTPNRGDCFSVLGIARDVAAITGATVTMPELPQVSATIEESHPVEVEDPSACPRFAGRIIRNIDPDARSPIWMTERLRRSGLRVSFARSFRSRGIVCPSTRLPPVFAHDWIPLTMTRASLAT